MERIKAGSCADTAVYDEVVYEVQIPGVPDICTKDKDKFQESNYFLKKLINQYLVGIPHYLLLSCFQGQLPVHF